MNLLFTTNKNYLIHVFEVLKSFQCFHVCKGVIVYILSSDVTQEEVEKYQKYLVGRMQIKVIQISESELKAAPTSKRYPKVIYYRLFAANYLPKDIDKILYLDPDIIINGNLNELYSLNIQNYLFAGATHIKEPLLKFNQFKNGASEESYYINTGVLLMNLSKMRQEIIPQDVYRYIEEKKLLLTLPDQDVINGLYGEKVMLIDAMIYNLADRDIFKYNFKHKQEKIDLDWVRKHTKIIHYYGKNKPWKENYIGILKDFYDRYQIIQ